MFNKVSKTFTYGVHEVTLETGVIAKQATGAVKISMGETVLLVTVVADKNLKEGQDFFPLTVDYYERSYAAGRIPGSFFRREGKQSEKEILTSRLIDRPIRPLFPSSFYHDVQIVATVLSTDPEINPDIPAMLGASAALMISGVPFSGPIGAARIGYIDGAYALNPTTSDLERSQLDLVISGTTEAVLMVESEAQELSEDIMLGAVVYGHKAMQVAINAIKEFAAAAEVSPFPWEDKSEGTHLIDELRDFVGEEIKKAYSIKEKQERTQELDQIWKKVEAKWVEDSTDTLALNALKSAFKKLEAELVRSKILAGEPRIDGRNHTTVRPINIQADLLPRVHGSVLFTRGETQALVATTLGTKRDEQTIDALTGEYSDRFIFHYNFPPYSTGEVGRIGVPKRREIGHGRLAKRALVAVLPDSEEFNYTIRVVSEITESNGSSSMASVCGGCLSMLSAGVPLKHHVAGIAMGLILEGDRHAILTDILGDEDHLGDMDFKVAGTRNGVTALQMDIKIQGITEAIMKEALAQAKEGRLHILNLMEEAVVRPQDLSQYAPRLFTLKIDPEKIRDVIGKGGETIRAITKDTHTEIDISEEGVVVIAATRQEDANAARARIEEITAEAEVGGIYEGMVTKLLDNNIGAIVSILPQSDGLVHVSQIAHERVEKVSDYLKVNDKVKVKVLDKDSRGRLKLSIKALIPKEDSTKKGDL